MLTIEKLQSIFREVFDDDSLEISEETTASDVDGWDSLSHINLVLSVEMAFGIRFALGELEELKNVGDMFKLINKKMK
jgi:acyl carrier protein